MLYSEVKGRGARLMCCLIFPSAKKGGVGTQLLLGCQDITGPFPSVLLDKAPRIYEVKQLNKFDFELNFFFLRLSKTLLYLYII